MAIDHVGVFFFPENDYLRIIGRLSFPLFAWAIANGACHTKNIKKYLLRLFLLAIISQIPYQLLFNAYGVLDPGLNILFTLSIGLLGIIFINKYKSIVLRTFLVFCLLFIAYLFEVDYGIFGVLSVLSFYRFYKSKIKIVVSYTFLVLIFLIIPLIVNSIYGEIFKTSFLNILELYSLLSLIIIGSYNGKRGCAVKWFFYLFYPLHFVLIYLVANILNT